MEEKMVGHGSFITLTRNELHTKKFFFSLSNGIILVGNIIRADIVEMYSRVMSVSDRGLKYEYNDGSERDAGNDQPVNTRAFGINFEIPKDIYVSSHDVIDLITGYMKDSLIDSISITSSETHMHMDKNDTEQLSVEYILSEIGHNKILSLTIWLLSDAWHRSDILLGG